MRKVIVSEFVSLDGVVEGPGGGEPEYRHEGWTFDIETDPTMYEYKLQEAQEAGALLLGRVTYDGFAAAWPNRDDEAGFAKRFNTMPKYVASTTADKQKLKLTSSKAYANGVLLNILERVRD